MTEKESKTMAVPGSLDEIGDQFMPGMDQTDFVPPVVTLVQGLSKAHTEDQVPLGVFYCAQSGEQWEKLNLVLLKVARSRVLFTPGELAAPVCQSDDRIVPRPNGKYSDQKTCEKCPARNDAPWLLSPEARTTLDHDPGLCLPSYTFLAVEAITGAPYIMRVNGTNVSPWKTALTTFRMRHKNVPFAASVEVGSKLRVNAQNQSFYVMTASVSPPFEMSQVQEYFAMAKDLQGVNLSAFEDEQSGTEEWIGTLIADPELHYTPDANPVLNLEVGVAGVGEVTVEAWDTVAEELSLLGKGQEISMLVRPPVEDSAAKVISFQIIATQSAQKVTRTQLREIMGLVGTKDLTPEQGKALLLKAFPGVEGTQDLSETQAADFIAMLKGEKAFPEVVEGAEVVEGQVNVTF